MSGKTYEKEAIDCYHRWLKAFNNRDIEGMIQEMHFPHWRISGANALQVWRTENDQRLLHHDMTESQNSEGRKKTVTNGLSVVHSSVSKVHFMMRQSRIGRDGQQYNGFDTLWIICLMDGKWGVQFRSSFSFGVSETGIAAN